MTPKSTLSSPPVEEVAWLATAADGRERVCWSRTWWAARQESAAALHCEPGELDVRRSEPGGER